MVVNTTGSDADRAVWIILGEVQTKLWQKKRKKRETHIKGSILKQMFWGMTPTQWAGGDLDWVKNESLYKGYHK